MPQALQQGVGRFPISLFSGHRLPKQVFSGGLDYFLFFELARAFSDGAWRMFMRLMREFDESKTWVRAVDPDPHNYYEANFGQAAEFEFSAVDDAQAYTSLMHEWPAASVADAIAYRADVIAWAGSSGRWAAWGERELNLCVLRIAGHRRLARELVLMPDDFVPLLTVGEALSSVVSSELGKEDLADFASDMKESYPTAA